MIGHATGLGALATVGAAAAEGFGGEALAGVGDAESAVDEDFEGEFGMVVGLEAFEFAEGEFAGEDGLVDAEAFGEFQSLRGGDGHLGGGVEAEARGGFFYQLSKAKVLDDDGVNAGVFEVAELGFGVGEFGGEDEGVEGDVTFDAVRVEECHQAGQVFFGEVIGAQAGVEAGHAEINGVGAVGDGGTGAVPVTGGGEEFGEEGH